MSPWRLRASASRVQSIGEPRREPGCADFARRTVDVVGNAHVGECLACVIEDGVTGSRVTVARLPDSAQHREPSPVPRQRNVYPANRLEARNLAGWRHVIERGDVNMPTERDV